jgi:proton-dependent oligopeptide transporter, POT family
VYLTPFLGALIADALFGKYRTIMTLSIVYCLGHACLAGMGVAGPAHWWLLAGLGLISIGSGGIKPCVSAHVGDQFGKSNAHLLSRVFFYFYFSINLGSAAATILIPRMLESFGPHVAFGLPGILMALATVVFWMGRGKFIHIPPKGAEFVRELTSKSGLMAIGKLFVIYIFVAVFWALFDQTGSSWVLQARDLDLEVDLLIWSGMLLPSEIQTANPIFVMILIAFFGFVVYPLLNRVWTLTPIRKIGMGLFVMVVGFAIVSWLQERIDAGETPSIWWQILAYLVLTGSEVMVSITALEYSYTQAPRQMKSIVMAVFLASVSIGNIFTATVNRFILVPTALEPASKVTASANEWILDHLAEDDAPQALPAEQDVELTSDSRYALTEKGFVVTLPGQDGLFDTPDDIAVTSLLNGSGAAFARDSVTTQGLAEARAAADIILESWRASGSLPVTEDGQALVDGQLDPWGQQLIYTLQNRLQFRVLSVGPDAQRDTKWDVGYVTEVADRRLAKAATSGDDLSWLDRRKAELGVSDVAVGSGSDGSDFEATAFVGGQTKLEGASYFWFFTWVMLGAALLFIPVGLVYRPKEYLQEEGPAGEA